MKRAREFMCFGLVLLSCTSSQDSAYPGGPCSGEGSIADCKTDAAWCDGSITCSEGRWSECSSTYNARANICCLGVLTGQYLDCGVGSATVGATSVSVTTGAGGTSS